jgi:hypothetical protein
MKTKERSKTTKSRKHPARGDRHAARARREIEQNLTYFAAHPQEIDSRLNELSSEPSLETLLTFGTGASTLLGVALGACRSRRWLVLPLIGQGLLAWHALKGRSPAGEGLRSLGVRTTKEIADERLALKVLRGDLPSAPELEEPLDLDAPRELLASVRR